MLLLRALRPVFIGAALLALVGTTTVPAGATSADELRRFHSALSSRATTTVDVALIGDSLTNSYGVNDVSKTLSVRLAEELRAEFPTAGVPGGNGFVGVGAAAALLSRQGGLLAFDSGYGPSHATWGGNGSGQYVRTTVTGDSAGIVYARFPTAGSLYWSIDGGQRTVVSTAGSSADGATLRITYPRGTHTLEVGWASGGWVLVEGVVDLDGDGAAGIRAHNLGWNGATTADWRIGAADRWTTAQPRALTPELVVIELGGNDFLKGRTSSAFALDLEALIASVRAQYSTPPSIVVMTPYELGNVTRKAVEPWANFVAAARAVADADPEATFVDLGDVMPPASDKKSGYYQRDKVHATAAGIAVIADHLAKVITAGATG